nr:hypothetical protein [Paramyrothecium roridum]
MEIPYGKPVTFNPGNIIQSLPSSENHDYEAIRSVANSIDISQPDIASREDYPELPGNAPSDMSDQFIVGNDWVEDFLSAQEAIGHRDEQNKWKLGVGIGVGVGVPILMTLTAVGTWLIVKRGIRERRGSDPKGI